MEEMRMVNVTTADLKQSVEIAGWFSVTSFVVTSIFVCGWMYAEGTHKRILEKRKKSKVN